MHISVICKDAKRITYKYKVIKCQSLREDVIINLITFVCYNEQFQIC